MQILETIVELRAWSRGARAVGQAIGLVPTMGALHAGHISMVQAARRDCQAVAVSIFVNPTQFGPNEDFSRYPRTFAEDCALLEAEGVEVVFVPSPEEMYPTGSATFVEVAGLSDRLDGASRPGHFRGVATIVAKLFVAAEPDFAYFGQKDAAQVAVIGRMAVDLALPVSVVVCPIIRESDGLAMSSRNRFLNSVERQRALMLKRALDAAEAAIRAGDCVAEDLKSILIATLSEDPQIKVDYVAIVDRNTLEPVPQVGPGTLVAVAAWIGSTRLIDNFIAR